MIDSALLNQETPRKSQGISRSLHFSFSWVLAGNVLYAFSQWGMVVALARLSTPSVVGRFMLGIAISTPVLLFANLQLRSILASDVRQAFSFREYFGVRTMTTSAALIIIAILGFVLTSDRDSMVVIVAVAVAKSIETFSDLFYGLFQLHDRLDLIGKSMILKGGLSILGFSSGLFWGGHILWAIAGLVASWTALLVLFDIRRGLQLFPRSTWQSRLTSQDGRARARTLIRATIPLGFVTSLVALNLHVPRYFIQAHWGEHYQGVFSAIAYTTVIVMLVADALGHTAIPRLARFYIAGEMAKFRSLIVKLVMFMLVAGAGGVVMAAVIGRYSLAAVFGQEYADYSGLLTWLMTAGLLTSIATVLTVGMTAARVFRAQVAMFSVVVGTNIAACALLVPRLGVLGAALAPVMSGLIHVLIAGVLIFHVSSRQARSSGYAHMGNSGLNRWEASL